MAAEPGGLSLPEESGLFLEAGHNSLEVPSPWKGLPDHPVEGVQKADGTVCVCPTGTFGTFPAASPNALPPLHPHQGRRGMEGVFSTGVHFGVMRLAILQKVGRQAVGSSDRVAAWDSPSPPNALCWGLK